MEVGIFRYGVCDNDKKNLVKCMQHFFVKFLHSESESAPEVAFDCLMQDMNTFNLLLQMLN